MLAFTNTGKQYIYTRMSQGFELSPNVFNQMLKADLEDLSLHSLILQYKDDTLTHFSLDQCHQDSID